MGRQPTGRPMGRPRTSEDGPKVSTLSVRLTARMKFGLEMMSRLHHTPIPDIVTRAINNVFSSEHQGLSDFEGDLPETNGYRDLLKLLWSERPSDRLVNIAFHCPTLLSLDEKKLWSMIKNMHEFWLEPAVYAEQNVRRDYLALHWEELLAKLAGHVE